MRTLNWLCPSPWTEMLWDLAQSHTVQLTHHSNTLMLITYPWIFTQISTTLLLPVCILVWFCLKQFEWLHHLVQSQLRDISITSPRIMCTLTQRSQISDLLPLLLPNAVILVLVLLLNSTVLVQVSCFLGKLTVW